MANRALISDWLMRFAVTNAAVEIESVPLKRAIEIATEAHRDQVDKANEPYILHSRRVMDQVDSIDEKIVGILHDVVEKNPQWSLRRLEGEGFKPTIIEAVDAMTRRAGESYEDFVSRAAANPISRTVKMADLRDNIQMARLCGLDDSKYRNALNRVLIGRLSP
jgi:(p)ppGpp synthase/HD superfamily hydrolase